MTPALLVIGYGNELRGDDAVGPLCARAVAAWRRPRVRALDVHQLTPELACEMAGGPHVVFVDAGLPGSVLEVRELAKHSTLRAGHGSDPRELIALAELLHGCAPRAWLIAVPATSLELGEGLSPECACGLEAALRHIRELADRFAPVPSAE
jgi:hydrogenase maturation protease